MSGVSISFRQPQDVVCGLVEDYPRDLIEFEARFGAEEACRDYLFGLRWPGQFPLSGMRA